MLNPDDSRPNERRLRLLPRCTKFSTAAALPIRTNDRKLKELPRCKKSRTLNPLPRRLKLRKLKENDKELRDQLAELETSGAGSKEAMAVYSTPGGVRGWLAAKL